MSSPCRNKPPKGSWAMVTLTAAAALAACQKTPNTASNLPATQGGPASTAVSQLFPGGGSPPPNDPRDALYLNNPAAIAAGKRLFDWYNCSGCHANGGGGMGPPLLPHAWRYGDRLDQIYATIYQGRPNGMPSWGGKIPDGQIWQLAAFVKSLSASNSAEGGEIGSNKAPAPTPPPPEGGAPPSPKEQSAAPPPNLPATGTNGGETPLPPQTVTPSTYPAPTASSPSGG